MPDAWRAVSRRSQGQQKRLQARPVHRRLDCTPARNFEVACRNEGCDPANNRIGSAKMPRSRVRVCLQDGLKLDLNRLVRKQFIKPGANIGVRGITWTHSYWGEVATGVISADMSGQADGWFRIQLGSLDQRIVLVSRPRHFGGRQWYFVCPVMNRLASVLWRPAGATRFCSRQTWGRQVAYHSQFNDATNRAHAGKARIKSRVIANLDPDEWDFPPKPKWMRWATYSRFEERFDHYEDILDDGCAALVARLLEK
ncbi:hypothetical protein JQ572_27345 [Bradyrhizobium japonicum]|nr:hypothetical protein [Bradyrhizobium japonicum]